MDKKFSVFFYDVRCAVVMHFFAWSGEIRTTIENITIDMLQFGTNSIFLLMFVESQRVHI